MAKFEIVLNNVDDIKIMNEITDELRTKIVHRGIRDYFYRKSYNAKNNESRKEYTKIKKAMKESSLTFEDMLKLVNEE